MPTQKKPKDWTAPNKIDLYPIPEHLLDRVGDKNILSKADRIVATKHLPKFTPCQRDIMADAIEEAVRVYKHAHIQDKRPKSTRVDARLEKLAHSAHGFSKELLASDDHTRVLVETARKNTPPPLIESDQTKGISSSYHEDPMIPMEDLINQVSQFEELFEMMIGSSAEKPGPRKDTAFPKFIGVLAQAWESVTGGSAKSSTKFVDLVSDVSALSEVRKIIRPTEDFRRKIQRTIKDI